MSLMESMVPQVFLLLGQSNMQGWMSEVAFLDPTLAVIPEQCELWDGDRGHLKAGQSLRENKYFGPEVMLMHQLSRQDRERKKIFIKVARGGHSITAFLPPTGMVPGSPSEDVEQAGVLGTRLDQLLDQLRSEYSDVEWGGLFFFQGERDARVQVLADQYEKNIARFLNQVESLTGEPNLPVLLARIDPPAEIFPARESIRRVQEFLAKRRPNTYWMDIDDIKKADDALHFTAEGQLEIGKRFSDFWLSHFSSKNPV